MAGGLSLEVTGVRDTVARLKGLSGKELEKKTNLFIAKAVRGVVQPAVRAEAPRGKGRPKGAYPHPAGNLKAQITTRKIRTRPGEMVAYSVRPRKKAFYAHMVIGGTKPHKITPRGLGGGFGSRLARSANRGGALALSFGGVMSSYVDHPGAKPNPFVARAAARLDPNALAVRLGKELLK